jgi:hypothetical protein
VQPGQRPGHRGAVRIGKPVLILITPEGHLEATRVDPGGDAIRRGDHRGARRGEQASYFDLRSEPAMVAGGDLGDYRQRREPGDRVVGRAQDDRVLDVKAEFPSAALRSIERFHHLKHPISFARQPAQTSGATLRAPPQDVIKVWRQTGAQH